MEQQLRRLTVKLEVSGTITLLENTTLYKDGYAFVGLRALVPVTPNRATGLTPLCTVHGVITDSKGNRKQVGKNYYNMRYVENTKINGFDYLIFERLMPKPLTDTVGELDLVFNYSEITAENKLASRLPTNILHKYVEEGGEADGEIDVDLKDGEVAQLNQNTADIIVLQDDMDELKPKVDALEDGLQAEINRSEELSKDVADLKEADTEIKQTITNNTVQRVTYDKSKHIITVHNNNGTSLVIDLPLEELFSDINYNHVTKQLILTKSDGSTISINISDLVDAYTGSSGEHISITIQNNVIRATLKNGSITIAQLSLSLQNTINYAAINANEAKIAAATALTKVQSVEDRINTGELDGQSGITVPIAGFFTMYVDNQGNLWVKTTDEVASPLRYDPVNGNLYYKI